LGGVHLFNADLWGRWKRAQVRQIFEAKKTGSGLEGDDCLFTPDLASLTSESFGISRIDVKSGCFEASGEVEPLNCYPFSTCGFRVFGFAFVPEVSNQNVKSPLQHF
jgi:hypothetical protein